MSCTGCETIIEKTLLGIDGVKAVNASFSENQVSVTYNPALATIKKMRSALEKDGYILVEINNVTNQTDSGADKPFSALQFVGITVVLLALYIIINSTVGFNFIPEVTTSMGYGVLFVVGLLTSLHCVAMCGGINMSQCVPKGNTRSSNAKAKIRPSLQYNLGRVVSYTVIGGIVGALGSAISFSGWAKGLIAILSGVFMVIMGLSMTGLFPWINKITPRLPKIFREKAGSASRGRGPFVVGLINGLMPCGPLQAMQIYALGTGSFIAGALSMFFFSIGTLPLMFGFGAIVTMLGSKFTKKMMQLSAILVAVLGVIMLGRGLVLSGVSIPSLDTVSATSNALSNETSSEIVNGVQNITSTLDTRGYPSITVQKDVPVVWNLQADAKSINGCNRTLIIPEYDLQVKLQAGDNIIKFTPTNSGTFTYSCWMGMITGQIDVVDDLGSDSAQDASEKSGTSDKKLPMGGGSCCAVMS